VYELIAITISIASSIGWLKAEIEEDRDQITNDGGDDHKTDVWEAATVFIILSAAMGFFVHPTGFGAGFLYAGLRVLLFDFLLNKRMGWPQYHFRNEGFDKIFYNKPPWFVWTVKGAIFSACLAFFVTLIVLY
jgi:hypothetical protein